MMMGGLGGSVAADGVDTLSERLLSPPAAPYYPDGLAFRSDLPDHLAGPDGWSRGLLNGTHNLDTATDALEGRGAARVGTLDPTQPGYTLTDTATSGISTLDYNVVNPNTGLLKQGFKTVYDPSVYSDATMLDLAQQAGTDAFSTFMQDPANSASVLDGQAGSVNFRSYTLGIID